MNRKRWRWAFTSSIMSLILCCVMLGGATYAWFTQIIESGHTLQGGNLDVELRYKLHDQDDWQEVTDDENLLEPFMDKTWEPGQAEYVLLEVSNVGELPVTYYLMVNDGTTSTMSDAEKEGGLLKWLKVGCITESWYQDASPSNAEMIELAQEDENSCSIEEGYRLSRELSGISLGEEADGEELEQATARSACGSDSSEVITLVIYVPEEGVTVDMDETDTEEEQEFRIDFIAVQQGEAEES